MLSGLPILRGSPSRGVLALVEELQGVRLREVAEDLAEPVLAAVGVVEPEHPVLEERALQPVEPDGVGRRDRLLAGGVRVGYVRPPHREALPGLVEVGVGFGHVFYGHHLELAAVLQGAGLLPAVVGDEAVEEAAPGLRVRVPALRERAGQGWLLPREIRRAGPAGLRSEEAEDQVRHRTRQARQLDASRRPPRPLAGPHHRKEPGPDLSRLLSPRGRPGARPGTRLSWGRRRGGSSAWRGRGPRPRIAGTRPHPRLR